MAAAVSNSLRLYEFAEESCSHGFVWRTAGIWVRCEDEKAHELVLILEQLDSNGNLRTLSR